MTDKDTAIALKTERAQRPELAETLDLHIAILEARGKIQLTDCQSQIQTDQARARLERGEPILHADDLIVDWPTVARLGHILCNIAARHRPTDAVAFKELATLFKDQPARVNEYAREYFQVAPPRSLDARQPSPVTFVLNNALHPFFAVFAQEWRSLVDDATWFRPYCPICGGAPDFAALEKESGARRLLCSWCDTEWHFQRATCPFCGENTPGKLSYYSSDNSVYRLYTCESCHRYLKTIDLRELARDVNLAAERVLTIGMDVTAREKCFH